MDNKSPVRVGSSSAWSSLPNQSLLVVSVPGSWDGPSSRSACASCRVSVTPARSLSPIRSASLHRSLAAARRCSGLVSRQQMYRYLRRDLRSQSGRSGNGPIRLVGRGGRELPDPPASRWRRSRRTHPDHVCASPDLTHVVATATANKPTYSADGSNSTASSSAVAMSPVSSDLERLACRFAACRTWAGR